jgi:N-acetylneuraminic acid mutarotase
MYFVRYCLFSALLLCASVLTLDAQWAKKANLPTGANDAANAFAINGKVYFGGGSSTTKGFYEYDPATNKWTRKADIPAKIVRAFSVSFAIDSKGYVATGQSDNSSGDFAKSQATVTNDLWEYDPSSNAWTQKASLPGKPRDGAMAFVIGDKAYVGGGVDSTSNYVGDFYQYDPSSDKWTPKASLPTGPIGFPFGFAVGGKGYMVGGGNPMEQSSAFAYDPIKDEWSGIADYPGTARQAGAAFEIDTLGYVGLGMAQYDTSFADIYSYNPKTDEWNQASPDFPDALGLGWPTVAVLGTTAYIGSGVEFPAFTFKNTWYSYSTVQALTAPVLVSPNNNASITDTAIDFKVQAVSGSAAYHLQIGMTADFSGPLFEQTSTTTTIHVPTGPSGSFYWRVAAQDANGKDGAWSAVRTFSEVEASVATHHVVHTSLAYPNPVQRILNLYSRGTITIIDALGREVRSAKNASSVDVSDLQNGSYRYELQTSDGLISGQFIKE